VDRDSYATTKPQCADSLPAEVVRKQGRAHHKESATWPGAGPPMHRGEGREGGGTHEEQAEDLEVQLRADLRLDRV